MYFQFSKDITMYFCNNYFKVCQHNYVIQSEDYLVYPKKKNYDELLAKIEDC